MVSPYFLVGDAAVIDLAGAGDAHIRAPRSGPYKGLVFAQAPGAPTAAVSLIRGNGQMFFEGTIYLPRQKLELAGAGVASAPPYTIIIANTLSLRGAVTFRVNADFAASDVPVVVPGVGRGIALVR